MTDRDFRIWVGIAGLFFVLAIWRGLAAAPHIIGQHP